MQTQGDLLKSLGQSRATLAHQAWHDRALGWIRALPSGWKLTSTDLIAEVDLLAWGNHNAVGAVFSAASKAGLIMTVGFVKSARAARHSGTIRVWQRV